MICRTGILPVPLSVAEALRLWVFDGGSSRLDRERAIGAASTYADETELVPPDLIDPLKIIPF